jgi:release factor glutamine methyltransferase
VVEGSWFDALPAALVVDLAVANPPYVATTSPDVDAAVRDWEPAHAVFAGVDGLGAIREVVDGARRRVRSGGWLVLEIGADQGASVDRLLAAAGFVDVAIEPDLSGRDRVAVARRP